MEPNNLAVIGLGQPLEKAKSEGGLALWYQRYCNN